jgi:N-dimethylarginine dimethylaminohydrolase
MVAPLRRVVVKTPAAAYGDQATIDRQYEALDYLGRPDMAAAEAEHAHLVELLEEAGAEVLRLPLDAGTGLDSLYTHDPALLTDRGIILLNMGKPARRAEPQAMGEALTAWGVPIAGRLNGEATAEGGDLVWLDSRTLLAGRTYRTNAAGIAQLRALLEPDGVTVLDFVMPHWDGPASVLHLMSVMSMLDDDLAVVYPRLMPVTLVELLADRRIRTVEVPGGEYDSLGCNVLALAPRRVLIRAGNPETVRRLSAAGCEVWEFRGDEIAYKGSGGPTCLTRPILRG